jgi:uncharacterized protein GlcG (DUF336 family)
LLPLCQPERQFLPDISLQQAQAAVDPALEKADEIGVAMNVAVVDAGNNLTAFARQGSAWLGSNDVTHAGIAAGRALPGRREGVVF